MYDGKSPPKLKEGEPTLHKQPIRVTMEKKGEKLHDESRLNYAKHYTVEHNSRVCFIGQVHADSKARLFATWKAALQDDTDEEESQREDNTATATPGSYLSASSPIAIPATSRSPVPQPLGNLAPASGYSASATTSEFYPDSMASRIAEPSDMTSFPASSPYGTSPLYSASPFGARLAHIDKTILDEPDYEDYGGEEAGSAYVEENIAVEEGEAEVEVKRGVEKGKEKESREKGGKDREKKESKDSKGKGKKDDKWKHRSSRH